MLGDREAITQTKCHLDPIGFRGELASDPWLLGFCFFDSHRVVLGMCVDTTRGRDLPIEADLLGSLPGLAGLRIANYATLAQSRSRIVSIFSQGSK